MQESCARKEKKAETCKPDRLSSDGAYMVRDEESISLSRMSSVLIDSVILEESLSFVKNLYQPV